MSSTYIQLPPVPSGGGGGGAVTDVNGGTGSIQLLAGTGMSVTTFGNLITFASTVPPVTLGTANGLTLLGQQLSLDLATASTTGALSASDWSTFNSKQPAGSYITNLTGDVTASGPGSVTATIATGAVTNSKIANGTIDLTTKVTNTLPPANGGTGSTAVPANGQILIGNGATYTTAAITAGTGIQVAVGPGSITINNTFATGTVNIDGGQANSIYGGLSPIDGGSA